MKNLLPRCTTGLISFIALTSCVLAQNAKPGSKFSSLISAETTLSNPNAKSSSASGHGPSVNVHARALKNFSKSYKAGNANWFEIKEGFLAEFQENGVKTKVFYDRKGNKTASIKSYAEDKLPKNIRHLVKSTYYDYAIYFVQEVLVGNTTAYLVKIEDKTSLKTIRVIDGEMDEYEAFTKTQ